ncbi:hypothetical protein BQ8794_240212 [Mesorhizobium prunaredense]|uniref:Uncharacterized protein n=1 Tax=Mesorhizobium prunaredense TaxID=1631249 RepID=A0A1R3V7Y4_9HYPH|nr:hypothetical protein BQ8794_240212 [Mesorhizobium prunaredense]
MPDEPRHVSARQSVGGPETCYRSGFDAEVWTDE